MENLYLLFSFADFYYLAPLLWVKSIGDGSAGDEELPILKYTAGVGGSARTDCRYRIVFENKELRFGLEADSVAGVEEIGEERLMELGEPVINATNKFLRSAVFMNTDGGQEILAYVLNLEYLTEKEGLWNS